MLIGVISDTHGTVPEWVEGAFKDVELIIHAGDVGSASVLAQLECIAPVIAVQGNMDSSGEVSSLPSYRRIKLEGVQLLVVHQPEHVRTLLASEPADVVVVGHTHRPRVQRDGAGHLIVNPGSASRSVGEGHSVGLLRIDEGVPQAQIVREPS